MVASIAVTGYFFKTYGHNFVIIINHYGIRLNNSKGQTIILVQTILNKNVVIETDVLTGSPAEA